MNTLSKFSIVMAICATGGIWFTYRAGEARASAPASQDQVRISVMQATVPEFLAAISEQLKKPVVLDGSFPEARKVSINFTGSRDELLQAVSRVLDVEVRIGKRGAILMCPKFENEEGLPQAEPVQIHAVASRVLKILPGAASAPTHQAWGDEIRKLGATLSQDQANELRRGGKVAWNDLLPQQQKQLAACLYGRLFGMARYHWAALEEATADLTKTSLILEPNTRQLLVGLRAQAKADPIRLGLTLQTKSP